MRHAVPIAVIVTAFLFCGTAEARTKKTKPPPPAPSSEHPKVGCILATLRQNGGREGRLLPEVVLVVGVTPIDDGQRWIVLRAPDFNPKKWEPHSREEILFGARCRAGRDLQQMFDASRGDVDASARTRPPND